MTDMVAGSGMSALSSEKYVRLTTFTRDGRPKYTPVWIADLGDGKLGFTTGLDSWKVKRMRNTSRVELTPSDMRGNVADGAVPTAGNATVVTGEDAEPVAAAIKAKYGYQVTMIHAMNKLGRLFRWRKNIDYCGVVISPDGP